MNYGKKGVHKKQKALHSTSAKWGRKLVLTLFNVALIARSEERRVGKEC